MIDRVFKKRGNVERFIENSIYEIDKNKIVHVEDRLIIEDWHVFIEIYNIFKLFYHQTKRFQLRAIDGIYGAIWEVYFLCEYLLRYIFVKKLEYV